MREKIAGYPLPQGCTINGNIINFSVCVPEEKKCELLLYKKGTTEPQEIIKLEKDGATGTLRYAAFVMPDWNKYEYNFRINDEIALDPYGKAFAGREHFGVPRDITLGEVRTKIVQDDFDWEGDKPLRLAENEIIAYSLHVRGFTKHSSSKVKKKGTFAGLIEKIPYLQELEINQIQCMPVYDFEENLKYTNYWGYGDGYFFAPKAGYAAGDPVQEMKQMVKLLHKAGIEIVIEMPFTEETPISMIYDCLRYWVMEYHVDGFILNPVICNLQEMQKDPVLVNTRILKKQDSFQNCMRRFLKGDEGMVPELIWWLKHHSEEEGMFNYITSHTGFTLNDVVSYDKKHNEDNGEDNQDGPDYNNSWNCGVEGRTRKKAVNELRKKQMRNAFFLLLTAQGTPCILAGDEFANSQMGNNNVYCQDNPTAWVEWNKLPKEKELWTFVKELIAFRKSHKVLHPEKKPLNYMWQRCGIPEISYHGENAWLIPQETSSRQLGVLYRDLSDNAEHCYITYNMHWLPQEFAIPNLPKGEKWYEVASTKTGFLAEPLELKKAKRITVEERSVKIFIIKQEEI